MEKKILTYEEAQELALNTKWKTKPCHAGEECWCTTIVPETPILYHDGAESEYYVIGSGEVSKKIGERIVDDHNKSLIS